MDKFFDPKSIAVIGASNSPFNLGATICNVLKNLDYKGSVYAVNIKGENVGDCRGYSTVLDINDDIDLAVILTKSKYIPQIAENCGEKGIKHLIIESAGFTEDGPEGEILQQQLDKIIKKYNIRYLGPNCLGVLNTGNRFCCFFGFSSNTYDNILTTPGKISYMIQSGGVGALVMDSLRSDITKINKMASIGNKADIDESDLLEYFNKDENTEVIGMYLENIQNGRKLFESAQKVRKPILVFKVGRSQEGAGAATSHTAGMANNDVVFDSACKQCGIIRLEDISELHAMPKIFTTMPLLKGKNIAVFTNSGAFGGIAADILVKAGLAFPQLSESIQEKLTKTGTLFNVSNPIDLGPSLSKQTFIDIFDILLSSDEIDGLMPVPNVWNDVVIETLIELVEMCQKYNKPAAIYVPNAVKTIISLRTKHNLPLFESPRAAVRALCISHAQYCYLEKKEAF